MGVIVQRLELHDLLVGGQAEQKIRRLQFHHRSVGAFPDDGIDRDRGTFLKDQFVEAGPLKLGAELAAAG